MRYFKIIKKNYNSTPISIDETELPKALHCFLTEAKGLFKNGIVRGEDIVDIKEDWHKAMGWNEDYKLGVDDWNEIHARGVSKEYKGLMAAATEHVKDCITSGRPELIGTVPLQPKQLSGGVKSIGEILHQSL